MASSFLRFLDHTQRRTTFGRTPLDKWSARRRDPYQTTHNTHNRQTSIPPVGFEPTISAGERPQTYALDRAAFGTGNNNELRNKNKEKGRRIAPAWNKNTSFSLLPTWYWPTLRYAYTVFLNHVTSPITGQLRHSCEHHALSSFCGCYFLQSTWLCQHLYGLLRC